MSCKVPHFHGPGHGAKNKSIDKKESKNALINVHSLFYLTHSGDINRNGIAKNY